MFPDTYARERFLSMYERIAGKYRWLTLAWVLRNNHHHFVVHLVDGGLSDGMRELHGGYSRWFHEQTGETTQGHLFRHAFFARQLDTNEAVLVACAYVDLNPVAQLARVMPEAGQWCGYRATVGLEQPRPFHAPSALLGRVDPRPSEARRVYQQFVYNRLVAKRRGWTPNDEDPCAVVESVA